MEKIIHFTFPKTITSTQTEIIERARALHPTWEIKIWQDPIHSDGYLLERYWPKANSGAQLADLIRLDVIYKWGGVYVDGDMRLLKPLDALVENYDVFLASAFGENLEGALIGARKAHPVIRTLIDDLLLNEPDWSLSPEKTTGPDLFARIARWNTDVTILPRETFYSYRPDETHSRKTHRHSYGEHLWEVSWKELIEKPPKRLIDWRSIVKRLLRPPIMTGFHAWHRMKALDRWAPEKSRPRSYSAKGEIVVRTVHGFNVIVDGRDSDRTSSIVFGDEAELRDEIAVKDILRGGDWVIEVGPRAGSFCMLAAQRVKAFGRVFVYQCDPTISNMITRSSVMNRMNDRVILRAVTIGRSEEDHATDQDRQNSTSKVNFVDLDQEFPIDLPIKLLKIDVESSTVAVLKGTRRLLERRCIDFVQIRVLKETGVRWRRQLGGTFLSELLEQLNCLIKAGYSVCTVSKDGLLIEHKNVTAALDRLQGRSIILRARDQYKLQRQAATPDKGITMSVKRLFGVFQH
jgi:inositol phosphorylceramide mannosyltransferase catalytic subunit